MLNQNNMPNLEDLINQLGRTKVKSSRIDAPGIGSGDFIDQEEISVVRNGVVETQVVTHNRLLDCGHLATVSSILAACHMCSGLTCGKCLVECDICRSNVCRHCSRMSLDRHGLERMLCDECRAKENRRRTAGAVSRAIAGFFVSREEA